MALTKLTTDLNNISALGDSPNNPPDSLTATQVKAKFDEAGNEIKTYINDVLTEEIDTSISSKINKTYTQLYNNSTGISDSATNITVENLSNYRSFIFETDLNSISFDCEFNNAKTKITGLASDISGSELITIHLTAVVSGNVITTLYIKNITHTANSVHGAVGTAYKITKIYGVV